MVSFTLFKNVFEVDFTASFSMSIFLNVSWVMNKMTMNFGKLVPDSSKKSLSLIAIFSIYCETCILLNSFQLLSTVLSLACFWVLSTQYANDSIYRLFSHNHSHPFYNTTTLFQPILFRRSTVSYIKFKSGQV